MSRIEALGERAAGHGHWSSSSFIHAAASPCRSPRPRRNSPTVRNRRCQPPTRLPALSQCSLKGSVSKCRSKKRQHRWQRHGAMTRRNAEKTRHSATLMADATPKVNDCRRRAGRWRRTDERYPGVESRRSRKISLHDRRRVRLRTNILACPTPPSKRHGTARARQLRRRRR